MNEAETRAQGLVEQGLELYAKGMLDAALAMWQAALQISPGVARAAEYIQYVKQNRIALENSFRAPAQNPNEKRRKEKSTVGRASIPRSIGDERPLLWPSDEASGIVRLDEVKAARDKSNMPFDEAELTPIGEMSWELVDPDAKNNDAVQSEADAQIPSPVTRSRMRRATPLTLLPGGAIPEDDNDFEPMELTPIGRSIPEPSLLLVGSQTKAPVQRQPAEDDLFTRDEVTPSRLREREALQPLPGGEDDGEHTISTLIGFNSGNSRPAITGGSLRESLSELLDALPDDPDPYADAPQDDEDDIVVNVVAHEPDVADYEMQLGDLSRIPYVCISQSEIMWQNMDHRAGFLLSQIDGMLSFDDVLDIAGMSRVEAMQILTQLLDQHVIAVRN